MADQIHAKQTPDGIRYRVYTTIADAYMTPEMTEAEVAQWVAEREIMRAIHRIGTDLPDRLARARERGTSSYTDRRDIDRWEGPGEDSVFRGDPDEEATLLAEPVSEHLDGTWTQSVDVDPHRPSRGPAIFGGHSMRVRVTVVMADETD